MQSHLTAQGSSAHTSSAPFIFADKSGDKNSPLLAPPLSKAVPRGYGLSSLDLESLEKWELAIVLLPVRDCNDGEFYTLADILPAVGTGTTGSLSTHAKKLWPNWEGRYRFDLGHARRLIRYVLRVGVKCHSREELLTRASGVLESRRK